MLFFFTYTLYVFPLWILQLLKWLTDLFVKLFLAFPMCLFLLLQADGQPRQTVHQETTRSQRRLRTGKRTTSTILKSRAANNFPAGAGQIVRSNQFLLRHIPFLDGQTSVIIILNSNFFAALKNKIVFTRADPVFRFPWDTSFNFPTGHSVIFISGM